MKNKVFQIKYQNLVLLLNMKNKVFQIKYQNYLQFCKACCSFNCLKNEPYEIIYVDFDNCLKKFSIVENEKMIMKKYIEYFN